MYSTLASSLRLKSLVTSDVLGNLKFFIHNQAVSEIPVLPKRIPRSSTDILKALAGTIGVDSTGPQYTYHDDPYLIPLSNGAKRNFALAKESGRKAALWIRDEHPNLFNHKVAEPFITAFSPKWKYAEGSEVNEETLRTLIKQARVADAINVYSALTSSSGISDELKQSFFEMLCLYNCEDPLDAELTQERWYKSNAKLREKPTKTWKDNNLADVLFNEIESKTSAHYCALIRGYVAYHNVEGAFRKYEEVREKSLKLDVETYNSLIISAGYLKEGGDMKWNLILELLHGMRNENVLPNIRTLNAALESISLISNNRQAQNCATQMLSEFQNLQIQPSLASYFHLLNIYCRDRGPPSSVLVEIVERMEKEGIPEIVDAKDTYFFPRAMEVAYHHLQNSTIASRVHRLEGGHGTHMSDAHKMSIYYRNYFMVLCTCEPLETVMEVYRELVPNIYVPEPSVFEAILDVVIQNNAIELLPALWTDASYFELGARQKTVAAFLHLLAKSDREIESDEGKQGFNTAWNIWETMEALKSAGKATNFHWTGEILGDLLDVCVKHGQLKNAHKVFQKLSTEADTVSGFPSPSTMKNYITEALKQNKPPAVVAVMKYSIDIGFSECPEWLKEIESSGILSETDIANLRAKM